MEIKIQLENENKRPFENWTEKSIKITKIKKWWIRKLNIQIENVNKNPTCWCISLSIFSHEKKNT